jgi:hypothetical protein
VLSHRYLSVAPSGWSRPRPEPSSIVSATEILAYHRMAERATRRLRGSSALGGAKSPAEGGLHDMETDGRGTCARNGRSSPMAGARRLGRLGSMADHGPDDMGSAGSSQWRD